MLSVSNVIKAVKVKTGILTVNYLARAMIAKHHKAIVAQDGKSSKWQILQKSLFFFARFWHLLVKDIF